MCTTWIPNQLDSRKQMRGFFLMTDKADPVTGQYAILSQTPVVGDKVGLSAQVYNYSTGVAFRGCEVEFSAVKYDPVTNREIGSRMPIGSTTISLDPRKTGPAQIVWDTTGFGPATGSSSQSYRIYVRLNSNGDIKEIYPPEDPNHTYGPGLPKGLYPGQNDEGFGLATVAARSLASLSTTQAQQAPVHLYLGSRPLMVAGPIGLTAEPALLVEQVGAQVQMRAQVCTSHPTRDMADVVIFDGPAADGKVIAWKCVPLTDACNAMWFEWVPSVRGNHTLVAEVLQDQDDPVPGHNQASLNVTVVGR
jgi:hypothetical protein